MQDYFKSVSDLKDSCCTVSSHTKTEKFFKFAPLQPIKYANWFPYLKFYRNSESTESGFRVSVCSVKSFYVRKEEC